MTILIKRACIAQVYFAYTFYFACHCNFYIHFIRGVVFQQSIANSARVFKYLFVYLFFTNIMSMAIIRQRPKSLHMPRTKPKLEICGLLLLKLVSFFSFYLLSSSSTNLRAIEMALFTLLYSMRAICGACNSPGRSIWPPSNFKTMKTIDKKLLLKMKTIRNSILSILRKFDSIVGLLWRHQV